MEKKIINGTITGNEPVNGTIGAPFNEPVNGTVNGSDTVITETTTLSELLTIIGDVKKAYKTPTPKALRETAGKPLVETYDSKVYANGYAVYDNGSRRTVLWLPSCVSFEYHFNPKKDGEQGTEIKDNDTMPEGLLKSQPWTIAVALIGEHRIETNSVNRQSSRTGTRDFDYNDNGDKDGDAEEAVDESYRNDYIWSDGWLGEDPIQYVLRKERQEEIKALLTDKQWEAFVLYYKEGYTQQEIADMLGIRQQKVSRRLCLSLEKIKKFNIRGV